MELFFRVLGFCAACGMVPIGGTMMAKTLWWLFTKSNPDIAPDDLARLFVIAAIFFSAGISLGYHSLRRQ